MARGRKARRTDRSSGGGWKEASRRPQPCRGLAAPPARVAQLRPATLGASRAGTTALLSLDGIPSSRHPSFGVQPQPRPAAACPRSLLSVSLPPVCQLPRRSTRPPCSPADPSARRTAPAPSAFLCRGAALAVGALLDPLRQLCREVLPRQKSVTGGAQPRDKANQRKESERFAAGPPRAACAPAEGEGQRAGGELNGEKARRRRPEQERPFTACGSTRQGERD